MVNITVVTTSTSLTMCTEWIKVTAYNTIMRIISRTTNRLFVGLPICKLTFCSGGAPLAEESLTGRDTDYVNLNIDFTSEVGKAALIINLFPTFLSPYDALQISVIISSSHAPASLEKLSPNCLLMSTVP